MSFWSVLAIQSDPSETRNGNGMVDDEELLFPCAQSWYSQGVSIRDAIPVQPEYTVHLNIHLYKAL